MPTVRMKVEAFGGLATLSTEYPNAEFTLLTSFSTEDSHVVLVKITGLDHEIARRHFETNPDVQSYEVLHDGDQELLVQFIQQSEPAPGHAARKSATPPPFPMLIQDGWVLSEATTTHDQLAQFTAELEAADIAYELLSIVQSTDPNKLLTDRQRQFVSAAIERGYYDSPRRCTLTDLAADLNVNKATASRILHRAEGAILKEFMDGPGDI
jgi:predicted DNA binding protein